MKNSKRKIMIIVIIIILIICSIAIAIGIYAQITDQGIKNENKQKETINFEELKNNFQYIFTNSINVEETANKDIDYNELVKTKYNIQEKEDGKYDIDIKIPCIVGDSEIINQINKEIIDVFGKEAVKIKKQSVVSTTYNLDYTAYVNDNIISLVLMCKYKDGKNAQRLILQSYNYDFENDKLLNLEDIIRYKNLNIEEMQDKINDEILKINSQNETIREQGYNVYLRDTSSNIYQIKNTPNFFLGQNNYLYLVYAYGNNNYTSEMDLVIF